MYYSILYNSISLSPPFTTTAFFLLFFASSVRTSGRMEIQTLDDGRALLKHATLTDVYACCIGIVAMDENQTRDYYLLVAVY